MPDTILYDSAMRLFGDLVTPEISAAAERGVWPERLWQAVEEAGYLSVSPRAPPAWSRRRRSCALPAIMRRRFRWPRRCSLIGYAPRAGSGPGGRLAIGPVEPGDRLAIAEAQSPATPATFRGLEADAIALIAGSELLVSSDPPPILLRARTSPASRATISPRSRRAARSAPLPEPIESVRCSATGCCAPPRWRGDGSGARAFDPLRQRRVQFGWPIASFKRSRSRLALLAEEAAAASVAVESAAIAVEADGPRRRSPLPRPRSARRSRRQGRRDRPSGARRDRLHPGAQPPPPDPAPVVVARRVRRRTLLVARSLG